MPPAPPAAGGPGALGPGGPPPMGMGPPPAPPPEPEPPVDPYKTVMELLRAVAESQGKDVAASLLMSLPKDVVDDLLQVAVDVPEDAEFLEALIPRKEGPVYPKWFVTPKKPTKKIGRAHV